MRILDGLSRRNFLSKRRGKEHKCENALQMSTELICSVATVGFKTECHWFYGFMTRGSQTICFAFIWSQNLTIKLFFFFTLTLFYCRLFKNCWNVSNVFVAVWLNLLFLELVTLAHLHFLSGLLWKGHSNIKSDFFRINTQWLTQKRCMWEAWCPGRWKKCHSPQMLSLSGPDCFCYRSDLLTHSATQNATQWWINSCSLKATFAPPWGWVKIIAN